MKRGIAAVIGVLAAVGAFGCSLETAGRAPKDCAELHEREPTATSGVRSIVLEPRGRPQDVYCEMDLGGGGWTLWASPDVGTFAGNAGMPRCGSLQQTDCFAGTYVERGTKEGLYLFYDDRHVFELTGDLRLRAVNVVAETHGPCPELSCMTGSTNCLFSVLKDGPGCCVDGGQNNVCL